MSGNVTLWLCELRLVHTTRSFTPMRISDGWNVVPISSTAPAAARAGMPHGDTAKRTIARVRSRRVFMPAELSPTQGQADGQAGR